ncbi:ABC transporter permease [Desulfocastanea catecholica]
MNITGKNNVENLGSLTAGKMLKRRLQARKGWVSIDFREIFLFKDILYFLTWKEIKVRYRQTIFGMAWAVMQPFFTMVVFSIFFGKLAKMPSDGIPYPLFVYSAMLPWLLFANGVTKSANSLVGNAQLLKKVYLPRIFLPLSTIVSGLVDFFLAFIILIGMMFYYGLTPTVNILWLPLFILAAVSASFGIGLILSALNVQFRDVRFLVPFIVQLWMFMTPVVYPTSLLAERWQLLYSLNPMVGVVDGFRWALLGVGSSPGPSASLSLLVIAVLLTGGVFYFRRMEKTFADVV